MLNKLRTTGALLLMVLFASVAASAWGPATHAYIATQLGHKGDWKELNKIYAAMAPDMFEAQLKEPYLPHRQSLSYAMHWKYMQVYDVWRAHTAWGYGFVSHNAQWGGDAVAHDNVNGYVTAKTAILKQALLADPQFQALGLSDAGMDMICHLLVEYGIDVLVKQLDPQIGQTVIDATMAREPAFVSTVLDAYLAEFTNYFGGELQAKDAIVNAEYEFRQKMVLYGHALHQENAAAVTAMAQQAAQLAPDYLALTGDTLPPGVPLQAMIEGAIAQSMQICAGDFAQNVAATAAQVKQLLRDARMRY